MTTLAEVNATLGVTNIALSGVAKEQKETNKGISRVWMVFIWIILDWISLSCLRYI